MEKIRRKLGEMPELQRSALEMAHFEGLTHSEIAAKTGAPLGTIKTRLAGVTACVYVSNVTRVDAWRSNSCMTFMSATVDGGFDAQRIMVGEIASRGG
jgi:hypothetical protein